MTAFSVARCIDKPESHGWFVVHTAETREHATARAMARDGVPVYMPGVVLTTKYRSWKTYCRRLPLFPEYVFAAFARGRAPDMRAWRRHGAEGLLTFTGAPTGVPWEVPHAAVRLIFRAERDGLLKRDVDKTRCAVIDTQEELRRMGYEIGQEIDWDWEGVARGGEDARVRAVARIKDVEPDMRVRLLFMLFNTEVEQSVPLSRLAGSAS